MFCTYHRCNSMMLHVRDVAKLLNVSGKKIYRLITQNGVPYYKIGEEYQFNHVELIEWATRLGIKVSDQPLPQSDSNNSPTLNFSDALEAGSILYDVEGKDKSSVLRNIVYSMQLPVNTDREYLLEILESREKLGSTGIGDGIAIPHVRNPVVLRKADPLVTICFLKNPIDFNSLDSKPVKVLFLLISPNIRMHLYFLSRLSFVLQNKDFKEAIQERANPDRIKHSLIKAESLSTSINIDTPEQETTTA